MSEQFSIFDPPRARASDPGTSHVAAARADEFAHEHFGLILAALKQGRGTHHELAARCGLEPVQVARRLPELEAALPPRALPTAETRISPRGRPCRVWALA